MAKKLAAFDFDNTLAVSDSFVVITQANGTVLRLNPHDYALYKKKEGDKVDYSEFSDIKNPVIIKKYMDILKERMQSPDVDVVIVTARGKSLGGKIAEYLQSAGVRGRLKVKLLGSSKPNGKRNYLRNKIQRDGYSELEFYDDSNENVDAVAKLETELGIKVRSILVPKADYVPLMSKSPTSTEQPSTKQAKIASLLRKKYLNPQTKKQILGITIYKAGQDHPAYRQFAADLSKLK